MDVILLCLLSFIHVLRSCAILSTWILVVFWRRIVECLPFALVLALLFALSHFYLSTVRFTPRKSIFIGFSQQIEITFFQQSNEKKSETKRNEMKLHKNPTRFEFLSVASRWFELLEFSFSPFHFYFRFFFLICKAHTLLTMLLFPRLKWMLIKRINFINY